MKHYIYLLVLIIFSCTNNTTDTEYNTTESENNTELLDSENDIISLEVIKNDYSKTFPVNNQNITGTVDSNINLTNIQLLISISENATISPNPANIDSLVEPVDFIITAENGEEKSYTVSIQSEGSSENKITSFNILIDSYTINTSIDNENSIISQKLPPYVDLQNITVEFEKSQNSTITPSPVDVVDYSSPVDFTVLSENGLEKTYTVNISAMTSDIVRDCDLEEDAWKWFGGDERTDVAGVPAIPYDRNVGTGQTITMENDSNITQFSVEFRSSFIYFDSEIIYDQPLDIKLNIRNQSGVIIESKTTTVPSSFNGGWVDFDLSNSRLFLKKDLTYIFTWHLVNGENIGVTTGSPATATIGNGNCYSQGYTGISKISENTDIENWSNWFTHPWFFNYKLEGLQ